MTRDEMFWAKIDRNGSGGCWIWRGSTRANGYGSARYRGRHSTAHRVVWERINGRRLRRDEDVCHTCDVRLCVNPAHLFIGSRQDNMQDCARKGRNSARLTPDQVTELRRRRAAGESVRVIAGEIGFALSSAKSMLAGRTYQWVPMDLSATGSTESTE